MATTCAGKVSILGVRGGDVSWATDVVLGEFGHEMIGENLCGFRDALTGSQHQASERLTRCPGSHERVVDPPKFRKPRSFTQSFARLVPLLSPTSYVVTLDNYRGLSDDVTVFVWVRLAEASLYALAHRDYLVELPV